MPSRMPETAPGAEHATETRLEFSDNRALQEVCGVHDRNLTLVEKGFDVTIARRGNLLALHGETEARARAGAALGRLYARAEKGRPLEPGDVDAAIRMPESPARRAAGGQLEMFEGGRMEIHTRKKIVEPRTPAQKAYARALFDSELVFGIGPAGTGKTYLAVAAAVSMFLEGRVDRIILSRPAVEAGERLGFLPGDMKEKIDPYLRPLYDAIHDMIPGKQLAKEMENGAVEVAPLAFMRGRTLSNAFVVLDEAQNTTEMQMKMFLTRLGEGSRMAITGDPSQVDLPKGMGSGLGHAVRVLGEVEGVAVRHFSPGDVVRHPLVARIVAAYDAEGARRG